VNYGLDWAAGPRFMPRLNQGSALHSRPVLYFMCPDGARWMVSHSGAQYPYRSREIAIDAAIDAANTSGLRGHRAEVQLRDEEGEWHPFWTYGQDTYPPTI
jgi:hypothetical protein